MRSKSANPRNSKKPKISHLFHLSNKQRTILNKQIQQYPEIRTDYCNFNVPLFATQDHLLYYKHYQQKQQQESLKKANKYNYNKNIEKALRIKATYSPYYQCQPCHVTFKNHLTHLRSFEHRNNKKLDYNGDGINLLQNFFREKDNQLLTRVVVNLRKKDGRDSRVEQDKKVLKELELGIKSLKQIIKLVSNLNKKL